MLKKKKKKGFLGLQSSSRGSEVFMQLISQAKMYFS